MAKILRGATAQETHSAILDLIRSSGTVTRVDLALPRVGDEAALPVVQLELACVGAALAGVGNLISPIGDEVALVGRPLTFGPRRVVSHAELLR